MAVGGPVSLETFMSDEAPAVVEGRVENLAELQRLIDGCRLMGIRSATGILRHAADLAAARAINDAPIPFAPIEASVYPAALADARTLLRLVRHDVLCVVQTRPPIALDEPVLAIEAVRGRNEDDDAFHARLAAALVHPAVQVIGNGRATTGPWAGRILRKGMSEAKAKPPASAAPWRMQLPPDVAIGPGLANLVAELAQMDPAPSRVQPLTAALHGRALTGVFAVDPRLIICRTGSPSSGSAPPVLGRALLPAFETTVRRPGASDVGKLLQHCADADLAVGELIRRMLGSGAGFNDVLGEQLPGLVESLASEDEAPGSPAFLEAAAQAMDDTEHLRSILLRAGDTLFAPEFAFDAKELLFANPDLLLVGRIWRRLRRRSIRSSA